MFHLWIWSDVTGVYIHTLNSKSLGYSLWSSHKDQWSTWVTRSFYFLVWYGREPLVEVFESFTPQGRNLPSEWFSLPNKDRWMLIGSRRLGGLALFLLSATIHAYIVSKKAWNDFQSPSEVLGTPKNLMAKFHLNCIIMLKRMSFKTHFCKDFQNKCVCSQILMKEYKI